MALIEYKNVEVRRKEHLVLENVTFSIDSGELVYLVGRVGSGKSSLLKTMYAEVPIESGEANVLGYDLNTIRRRDIPFLRRRLGIVFQDFQLLTDRNVQANLEFVLAATGMKNAAERSERIEQVLHRVGMNQKSYKMPHELSGGEQQRIVIARALLNNPEVILADEPTGNLDPETGEQIFSLLTEISMRGTSVVLATHNHAMIDRYPGRVFISENRRLSELP
ncbi:MAG: ATP-binding cassette domain-containing protein [Bacteroidales bacterium]|nr:ATP-binding cassette domain-containing protein [Bacteroidales bacterium]MDY2916430.1 ATP-binding cassette domain-containing protein [Muribaculaceae bacterium]